MRLVKRVTAILLLMGAFIAVTATASAAPSNVAGTVHDIAVPGTPVCEGCHIPHNAQGDTLWSMTPKVGMSGLQALCFSCHDGSVSAVGTYVSDPSLETHEVTAGANNQDCDRCHDPHEDTFKFIKAGLQQNADICQTCHGVGGSSHPVDTNSDSYAPVDSIWNPYAATPDFSGTRLWNASGTLVIESGSGDIKCMTCHTPHGAANNSLNSMQYAQNSDLCVNCH